MKPLKIGITGGIGSGKSTVCQVFKSLGVPVYDSDYWAKHLLNIHEDIKKKIIDLLGSNSYDQNNQLDRPYVSKKVFNNKNLLNQLNAIVHPAVASHYTDWQKNQKTRYTLKETALLFELDLQKRLDKVIVVYTPLDLRYERILKRDKQRSKVDIQNIMNKQKDDKSKISLSDWIIYNDETKPVLSQILQIHDHLLLDK